MVFDHLPSSSITHPSREWLGLRGRGPNQRVRQMLHGREKHGRRAGPTKGLEPPKEAAAKTALPCLCLRNDVNDDAVMHAICMPNFPHTNGEHGEGKDL